MENEKEEKNDEEELLFKIEIINVIEDFILRVKFLKKISKNLEKWFKVNVCLNLILCVIIGLSNCKILTLMNIFLCGVLLIHFLLILIMDGSRGYYIKRIKDLKGDMRASRDIDGVLVKKEREYEKVISWGCFIKTMYRKHNVVLLFIIYLLVMHIIIKEEIYYMIQF